MPVLDVFMIAYSISCQIYIQPNKFDKYTTTLFLPVVKMAMSKSNYYTVQRMKEIMKKKGKNDLSCVDPTPDLTKNSTNLIVLLIVSSLARAIIIKITVKIVLKM